METITSINKTALDLNVKTEVDTNNGPIEYSKKFICIENLNLDSLNKKDEPFCSVPVWIKEETMEVKMEVCKTNIEDDDHKIKLENSDSLFDIEENFANIEKGIEHSILGADESDVTIREDKNRVTKLFHGSKHKAKIQRNSGEAYISLCSGKHFEAKTLRPPCGSQCKLQCSKRIDEDARRKIFEKYWGMKDLLKQRKFISQSMHEIQPAYRYPRNEKHRRLNNAFYFEVGGQRLRVCKSFFKATLDINDRSIRTVVSKIEKGFISEDLRGKHNNHKRFHPSIKDGVRKHIESIPRIKNSNPGNQDLREFIDGGKSLADWFRDYKNKCIYNGVSFANPTMYSRIFNTDFNISFFCTKE